MENRIPFDEWAEMIEDANELYLLEQLEYIRADTEKYRAELAVLEQNPEADPKEIESYKLAIQINIEFVERLENSDRELRNKLGI